MLQETTTFFFGKMWNWFWWATFVVHATVEYSYYVTSPYLQDDFQRGGVTLLPRYELATVHSWERRCKQWSKDGVGLGTRQYFGKDLYIPWQAMLRKRNDVIQEIRVGNSKTERYSKCVCVFQGSNHRPVSSGSFSRHSWLWYVGAFDDRDYFKFSQSGVCFNDYNPT